MIRQRSIYLGLWVFLGWSVLASAQGLAKPEEVLLSIDVGYNSAYRDKSWVPVDVMVHNEQADLNGMLEVRSYDAMNRLQSPLYQLPVNCPKDSIKRFRLMAYIDNAERVEARIYEGGRSATDSPAYIQVRPIDRKDLLGLILDDDPLNYQFLNMAIEKKDTSVRFHRQPISTASLVNLPGHIKAYESFDFVVIGEIDASRVPEVQRQLLREYVETGGILIICTGLNGNYFRRTWVEELSGVSIGATETVQEVAAGAQVFLAEQQDGLRAGNDISFTELSVPEGDFVTYGAGRTLATRRSVGTGWVCTIAVDAKSHAFQETDAYQAMWAQMMFSRRQEIPLNYELFSTSAAQAIPSMSGITVQSLGYVMIYLLLYIGVGIIGNWLFWNRLKRREMAWVCLVVFSFGFSAFAYVSGTAGWAKSSETQQIDIVHLKQGVPSADYYGLTGVLTSRTENYSASQPNAQLLMRDIGIAQTSDMYGYPQQRVERTPFVHVQGDAPRLERFTVGASELRFAALDGRMDIEGGVEGELVITEEGIEGRFANTTSLGVESLALVYQGVIIPMRKSNDEWQVSIKDGQVNHLQRTSQENVNQYQYQWYGYYSGDDGEAFQRMQSMLFRDSVDYMIPAEYPPMVVGWSESLVSQGLTPDGELVDALSKTLLVAEVAVRDERPLSDQSRIEGTIPVKDEDGYAWSVADPNNSDTWGFMYPHQQLSKSIELRLPHWMVNEQDAALEISVYVEENAPGEGVATALRSISGETFDAQTHGQQTLNEEPMSVATFRIEKWREFTSDYDERSVTLEIVLDSLVSSGDGQQVRYFVSARGYGAGSTQGKGDWAGWR